MSLTICMTAGTLYYPNGGGNLWLYLNWALSFKSMGCRVIWLEGVYENTPVERLNNLVNNLKERLSPFGLAENIALWQTSGKPLSAEKLCGCLDINDAGQTSLFFVKSILWNARCGSSMFQANSINRYRSRPGANLGRKGVIKH